MNSPAPAAPASAPVPVVPATRSRLLARAAAQALIGFGAVAQTVVQLAPQLTSMFPNVKWLPGAIAAVGFVWQAVQKFRETWKSELVNYSQPNP